MSTFVGRKPVEESLDGAVEPIAEAVEFEPQREKTRADLVEEAESLGIKVPPKANKAAIQKLIDEAPVM